MLKRTEAVAVPPGFTVTESDFRPSSGWMNVTVWLPALTLTPTLGVLPRGLPSSSTLESGSELMFSVPPPPVEAGSLAAGSSSSSAGFW